MKDVKYIFSPTLRANFKGIVISRVVYSDEPLEKRIIQHRGIKFGTIPARFAKALPKDDWGGQIVDCTEFGYEYSTVSNTIIPLTALQTTLPSDCP